jgi:hypothetical protein
MVFHRVALIPYTTSPRCLMRHVRVSPGRTMFNPRSILPHMILSGRTQMPEGRLLTRSLLKVCYPLLSQVV